VRRAAVLCLSVLAASCASAEAATPASRGGARVAHVDAGWSQAGMATWYGDALAGHKTASGERFDPGAMTAAHRTLPLGTWVEVTRVDTGKRVRVRINDRGPFGKHDRVIDLSKAAAKRIDMLRAGVVRVELRVVDGP
jgi:rare lipoprotein A